MNLIIVRVLMKISHYKIRHNTLRSFFMTLVLFLGFSISAAAQTAYYLDGANGNDLNNGRSLDAAWKTFAKANVNLGAGDTVYVRGGIYSQYDFNNSFINPSHSGSANAYITYINYNHEEVILTGCSEPIRLIEGHDYIRINGFIMDGISLEASTISMFARVRSNYNIIKNCTMRYCKLVQGGWNSGIRIFPGSHHNKILKNTLHHIGCPQPPYPDDLGEGIYVERDAHHNLIEGNDVSYVGHNCIAIDGTYNVIRGNYIHNPWGRPCALGGGEQFNKHNIYEDNDIAFSGNLADASWPNYGMQSDQPYGIIRFNRFYQNYGQGLEIYGYRCWGSHTRAYHNVFSQNGTVSSGYTNHGYGVCLNELSGLPAGAFCDVVVKNNIIYNNRYSGVYYKPADTDPADHFVINNHNDSNGSPQFADPGRYDFHLLAGSPCIDAGAFLTQTVGAGAGATLSVQDVGYFIDGFGIVEGDLIQLSGQTTTARIIGIDYESHILYLDRSLNWNSGQGVSLAYSGATPDIGSYEYEIQSPPLIASSASSTDTGEVPVTVEFTASASGGISPYSFYWNFGDGASSTAQNPSHTYSQAGTFTAALTVTDNLGKTDSDNLTIQVNAEPDPLSASASASPESGFIPLTIEFTGSAVGGTLPYSFHWEFGDGAASDIQNPSHAYSQAGTYTAVLTLTDDQGRTDTASVLISALVNPPPPQASLSASPLSGVAPLAVTCTAHASGGTPPYTYHWDFGDGSSSTNQNPIHTFTQTGTFTMTLVVFDSAGKQDSDSTSVSVSSPPHTVSTPSTPTGPVSGGPNIAYQYTSGSAFCSHGHEVEYRFDWGDGTTSSWNSTAESTKTWVSAGSYTVRAQARCASDGSILSSWSGGHQVSIESTPTFSLSLSSATLSPAPGQGGTTDPGTGNHVYAQGESAHVAALANPLYRFSRWSGDITGTPAYESSLDLTMDQSRSLTAVFCTRCGDVNGDLGLTPSDAQAAFEIFLGIQPNPTHAQLENADVNCDGTVESPKVTPGDAQAIFEKFLGIKDLPTDCSAKTRAGGGEVQAFSRAPESTQDLICDSALSRGSREIIIPMSVSDPNLIEAFGFDLLYDQEAMDFVGIRSTPILKAFTHADAFEIAPGQLRVGGYRSEPLKNTQPAGVLINLIFKLKSKSSAPGTFLITNTVDDISRASIKGASSLEDKEDYDYVF